MGEVHLGCQSAKQVEEFKYLGTLVRKVTQMSPTELRHCGQNGGKAVESFTMKFYKTVMNQTLLNGSVLLSQKKRQEQWISGSRSVHAQVYK